MDGTNVHDADVNTFGGERIARTEVVELLELGSDVRRHHQPVGGTTEGGSVDDVRHFERLVHQSDVAVGVVNASTSSGRKVVSRTDSGCNDKVVDDFTVDFRNHFIGHEVGEGRFGIDVVNGLKVLSGFQGPRGLELTGDSGNAVTVDAQGDFGLEGVSFEIVLVVGKRNGANGERSSAQGHGHSAGGAVESGGARSGGVNGDGAGEASAIADEDHVRGARAVERDPEAGGSVIAIWSGISFVGEHFNDHGARKHRTLSQGATYNGVSATDGERFVAYFLRRVIGVKRPAVLAAVSLGGVLTHDLRTGNGLTLGHCVAIADVENQAGGLAHWLNANEVISDQLGVALADEGESETGEVSDISGGGLIFEDHATILGIPGIVLVFQDGGHEAELLLRNFTALTKNWRPFLDAFILFGFVND